MSEGIRWDLFSGATVDVFDQQADWLRQQPHDIRAIVLEFREQALSASWTGPRAWQFDRLMETIDGFSLAGLHVAFDAAAALIAEQAAQQRAASASP